MKINITLFLLLLSQFMSAQTTILWKATDTTTNKISYIVGTFHLFGNSFVDSIPEIKENLYQSDLAIFESIEGVETSRKLIQNRKATTGIEKGLKKKTFQNVLEYSKDWKVDIYKLKPVEVWLKLEQEYWKTVCRTTKPSDTWDSFDGYLQYMAEQNGLEVMGLESTRFQLNALEEGNNSPNWKKEKKRISFWLNKLIENDYNPRDCKNAIDYRNYNLDYELNTACEESFLLKSRTDNWMQQLSYLMKEKNCFVAVGYLHLKYECGLIQQLRAEGFVVEPVVLNPAKTLKDE